MGTVTVAATYGAGGNVIAPAVAERLGLPFIDRAIPVWLAEEIHQPLDVALADDADHTPQVTRLLDRVLATSGLFVGVSASPEQRGALPEVARTEETLRRVADATGAVILGRAGASASRTAREYCTCGWTVTWRRAGARPPRVTGSTWRRPLASSGRRTARASRTSNISIHGRAHLDDPRHYHVVLDSTVLSHEACIEIIVRAARDLFSEPATASGRS